jgi:hypothetical protein
MQREEKPYGNLLWVYSRFRAIYIVATGREQFD